MIFSSLRVFLLALLPFLLCLFIYIALISFAFAFADNLADTVIQPGAWWRSALRVLIIVAIDLTALVATAFTYTWACLVIAAPLYEFLSASVEKCLRGTVEEEPFSLRNMVVDIWRALIGTGIILCIELGVLVVGLLLAPFATIPAVLISAVLLSLEYLDYPMGRRRMKLGEKFAYARTYVWELLGLGLPLLVAMAIPFVGAAFLPLGVVGGTILFVEIRRRRMVAD